MKPIKQIFMSRLLLISWTIFICTSCFGQNVNDDDSYFNYTYNREAIRENRVKTVTVAMYQGEIKFGSKLFAFDTAGLLVSLFIFEIDTTPISQFIFIPDSNAALYQRIKINYHNHKSDTVTFYKFFNAGKIERDSSTEMHQNRVYEYDRNGYLSKILTYTNNELSWVKTYLHDHNGRITNIKEYVSAQGKNGPAVAFSNRDLLYDTKNRIEQEQEKVPGNSPLINNRGSSTYIYDGNNNIIKAIHTNAASYSYEYDSLNLLTKRIMQPKIDEPSVIFSDVYYYTFY
jgi:YD repeat-containing protein